LRFARRPGKEGKNKGKSENKKGSNNKRGDSGGEKGTAKKNNSKKKSVVPLLRLPRLLRPRNLKKRLRLLIIFN